MAVYTKIFKKLRTASLNSEFTGSYKKKCIGRTEEGTSQQLVVGSLWLCC